MTTYKIIKETSKDFQFLTKIYSWIPNIPDEYLIYIIKASSEEIEKRMRIRIYESKNKPKIEPIDELWEAEHRFIDSIKNEKD